jgi:voltage-gated potassium channel Kch
VSLHTDQFPAMHTRVDALYFTVTTLGTVGFGDIVPAGQAARLLVTIQIMLNLMLIGAAFRLIGQRVSQARGARTP